jgi:hypothetical protein
MKPMTREDAISIGNYRNRLVPLSVFRKQLELRNVLEEKEERKVPNLDSTTEIDESIKQLRIAEQKAEDHMAKELINSTLKSVVKEKSKRKK